MATATDPAVAGPALHAVADLEILNEGREIERVVSRLLDRYPMLSLAEIERVVSVALHAFDGARVRHFVPLLVERLADESLESLLRDGGGWPSV